MSDLIFGKNSVVEALDSNKELSKLWLLNSSANKFKDIEMIARKRKIPVQKLSREEFKRVLSKKRLDQSHLRNFNIAAEMTAVEFHDLDFIEKNDCKKILFPVNVEDAHNLGALIRSAKAFGVDAVMVLNRRNAPVNELCINASAGAALQMPLIRCVNANNSLEKLKKMGFWIYGTDVKSTNSTNLYQTKFDSKSVILMGNEAKGLSDNIKSNCDFMLHIPCQFESLNVSVAAGIIMAELFKQSEVEA